MPLEPDYASVLSSPTQESLPPYPPGWRRDENAFVDGKEEGGTGGTEKGRRPWGEWRKWAVAYGDAPHVFNTAFDTFWSSSWKKKFVVKEQVIALLLVTVLGVVPLALLGHFSPTGSYYYKSGPFSGIFEDKIMSCGTSFGTPENATVRGVEKMFVLDQTYGRLTFAQAKTIDVFWDIAIGRGVQMIAWWVGYIVFSDALLRAIERHPASFRIFQRIALEGPSLLSLITLVKELWRARSKRTRALFFYIWVATLYIISIPMFLSAMTGYDSTSTPWVSLDDDNNIVPASTLRLAWWAHGTFKNETFGDDGVCLDINDYSKVSREMNLRESYCDCQLKNGTIVAANKYIQAMNYVYYNDPDSDCLFDFEGNTKTFKVTSGGYYGGNYYGTIEGERNCNSTFDVTINNKKYDASKINGTSGYCYADKPYSYPYLADRSRCLPDTANPTYQWGFSSMLSGLFVFFHFTWVVSMYIVWQDAHWNSKLVSTGYQMTPLRAAFAMAKAAKRKTGLGEKQLVRANTKELEQELYGSKTTRPTEVEFGIFEEDEEHGEVEFRRRIVRPRDEDEEENEDENKDRDKDRDKRKSVEVEVRKSGEMSDVPLNP